MPCLPRPWLSFYQESCKRQKRIPLRPYLQLFDGRSKGTVGIGAEPYLNRSRPAFKGLPQCTLLPICYVNLFNIHFVYRNLKHMTVCNIWMIVQCRLDTTIKLTQRWSRRWWGWRLLLRMRWGIQLMGCVINFKFYYVLYWFHNILNKIHFAICSTCCHNWHWLEERNLKLKQKINKLTPIELAIN